MSVLYSRFERHGHGEGLRAHTTHYCPGCGHGLAHQYLAQAIEALGVQDRTVAVSPVGCSVFMYYYLDVGNTQAAHGRAPAVAIGHKLANPESIVVSYQGDGDLASIGLAEIIQVAALGIPISVIFVNNAIYGMTGGQLAPTTLLGQRTSTSPNGRDRSMGQPLKMAELIAQLDGPVYVERVALFDAKQRARAAKAIHKGLQLQVENRGFSFVEVLAECPTHLGLTPVESERWIREKMLPVFPLGVKKDLEGEAWGAWATPRFDAASLLELVGAHPADAARASTPSSVLRDEDMGLKLAGSGGDGAQTAGMLIARAAISAGFDATHIPSYGPESRGGTSYADVRVARHEVLSPDVPAPHALVAFNAPSLAKFSSSVQLGGVVIYDCSVIRDAPPPRAGIRWMGVPCTEIATALGQPRAKNVVALGALHAAAGLLSTESFSAAIRQALGKKGKEAVVAVNEEAFLRGARAASES